MLASHKSAVSRWLSDAWRIFTAEAPCIPDDAVRMSPDEVMQVTYCIARHRPSLKSSPAVRKKPCLPGSLLCRALWMLCVRCVYLSCLAVLRCRFVQSWADFPEQLNGTLHNLVYKVFGDFQMEFKKVGSGHYMVYPVN